MSDIALGISDADMKAMIARVHADKHTIVPECSVCGAPCGRTADYDWESVYREERTEHEEGNRDGNVAEPSVISDVRIDILSTLQKISHRVISGEINADGEVNFSVCRAVFPRRSIARRAPVAHVTVPARRRSSARVVCTRVRPRAATPLICRRRSALWA